MRILAYFAASLEGMEAFRAAEIRSIAQLHGFDGAMAILDDPSEHRNALCLVDVPGAAEAVALAARSVLLHNVSEVFAVADDLTALGAALRAIDYDAVFARWMGPGRRYKFILEGWGQTYSQAEKVAVYNTVGACFPAAQGTIDVRTPETTFMIVVDHDHGGRAYFTRFIAEASRREVLHRYRLPARPHIGTTSMPPELCFVMANLGLVRRGDTVYDCFCGTGSTLVSAGHYGAMCFGADRDARTMRGPMGSIYKNFEHYGLRQGVELIRLSSESNAQIWRGGEEGIFDAILTDPPYGIREPSKKVDRKRCDELPQDTFVVAPPSEKYEQCDVETDLVAFAAKGLRLGRRLVYWHPTVTAFNSGEIPSHRCMRLVCVHGQKMNLRVSRQLVVFEKIAAWREGDVGVAPAITRDLRALYFNTGPEATAARAEEEQRGPEGSTPYERYLAKRAKKREAIGRYHNEGKDAPPTTTD